MAGASAVCFGTLAQRNAKSRETILRALGRATNAFIVYDVNLRQTWYQKDWVEGSLEASNIVKLNEDEVTILSQVMGMTWRHENDFARAFIENHELDIVCVTRAERGCSLYTRSHNVDVSGVEIEVADAVGAGDAFTAALISAQLRGWPLATAAWFANHVGALVAGRRGAMPVLHNELGRLIARAKAHIHSDADSRLSRREKE
jgi:fructokinase